MCSNCRQSNPTHCNSAEGERVVIAKGRPRRSARGVDNQVLQSNASTILHEDDPPQEDITVGYRYSSQRHWSGGGSFPPTIQAPYFSSHSDEGMQESDLNGLKLGRKLKTSLWVVRETLCRCLTKLAQTILLVLQNLEIQKRN